MTKAYQPLLDMLVETGISEAEAEHAVRRCATAMAKQGVTAYASAGALAYFMNMTPASGVSFAITTMSLGAGHALLKSPSCGEVRNAIGFWNTAPFTEAQ
jgi:hypothetical protein